MTDKRIKVLVFENGDPVRVMTKDEFLAEYGAVRPGTSPAVPDSPGSTPPPPTLPEPITDKTSLFLGKLIGRRYGNAIHRATANNHYYEVAGEKLWPRGTNLGFDLLAGEVKLANTNPSGNGMEVGVPGTFSLPQGWGWYKSPADGAYAIVPELTPEPGPDWLQTKQTSAVKPSQPVEGPSTPATHNADDQSGENPDNIYQ